MDTDPGVLLLDKPRGQSSFAALGTVKRVLATRKVGHTGTLDPFATGLLVALVGPATRCARFFSGLPKAYRVKFAFGVRTDTDDLEGREVERTALPDPSRIAGGVARFIGTFEQLPPDYSAVHVHGARAHELARAGKPVRLEPRQVTVLRFDVHSADERELDATIECSAGTYVRALARDLGATLASAAHVTELRRISVGPFIVDDAVPAEAVTRETVRPLPETLGTIPGICRVVVSRDLVDTIRNGGRIEPGGLDAPAGTVVLECGGELLAVGDWDLKRLTYHLVIPGNRRD